MNDNVSPLDALTRGDIRIVSGGDAPGFLAKLAGKPLFACVIGTTKTAEIEGISAAGATPEKRRYTAALDAEFLVHQRPVSLPDIPRNPLGPPSPVVITLAALKLMGIEAFIVDAGTEVEPKTPRITIGAKPGRSIVTGRALDLADDFSRQCRAAGRLLARNQPWVVLAESAPGGTTTALSVLKALGFCAEGKVSSSMPGGNHSQKEEVVATALANANLPTNASALAVASAVGDPMQPALALMALEASLCCPVVLGGGTQMAAVYALMKKLAAEGEPCDLANVAIATTRWVSEDPHADLKGIMEQIDAHAPVFSAWLDFSSMPDAGLRRYEEGLVKEGVGAGAAAFAALVSGSATMKELLDEIFTVTDGLDVSK